MIKPIRKISKNIGFVREATNFVRNVVKTVHIHTRQNSASCLSDNNYYLTTRLNLRHNMTIVKCTR